MHNSLDSSILYSLILNLHTHRIYFTQFFLLYILISCRQTYAINIDTISWRLKKLDHSLQELFN